MDYGRRTILLARFARIYTLLALGAATSGAVLGCASQPDEKTASAREAYGYCECGVDYDSAGIGHCEACPEPPPPDLPPLPDPVPPDPPPDPTPGGGGDPGDPGQDCDVATACPDGQMCVAFHCKPIPPGKTKCTACQDELRKCVRASNARGGTCGSFALCVDEFEACGGGLDVCSIPDNVKGC